MARGRRRSRGTTAACGRRPAGAAIHIVDRPGATQSELRVGLPGPARRHADYFPLLVGNTVLGGAFTSRLNILLREEKAYTYGAGSSFAFRAGGGPFLASTAVFTAATADAVRHGGRSRGCRRSRCRSGAGAGAELSSRWACRARSRRRRHSGARERGGAVRPGRDYLRRVCGAVRAVTRRRCRLRGALAAPDELSITVVGDADGGGGNWRAWGSERCMYAKNGERGSRSRSSEYSWTTGCVWCCRGTRVRRWWR
jgi:hypothetical protein